MKELTFSEIEEVNGASAISCAAYVTAGSAVVGGIIGAIAGDGVGAIPGAQWGGRAGIVIGAFVC